MLMRLATICLHRTTVPISQFGAVVRAMSQVMVAIDIVSMDHCARQLKSWRSGRALLRIRPNHGASKDG